MEGLPVKFWGIDPLYWANIKLFVVDVLKLPQYPGFQDVYAISNHPIIRVHVLGFVVSVDRRQQLTVYRVDDGTALISCCHWIDEDDKTESSQQVKLGDLASVLGKITIFRGQRQITISSISVETDPNSETLHWLEVLRHMKELYDKPFVVPAKFNPKPQTVRKHWLQSPLDVEIDEMEEELKKSICDCLESTNMLSFTADNLYTVSELKEKAKLLSNKYHERLKENYGTDVPSQDSKAATKESKNASKTIIRPLLRRLEKDGIVYCKNVYDGCFDFLSVNKDLGPRILGVIKDICENDGETSDGVSRSKIIQKLKSLDKYKCVRRNRIITAMNNLLVSGDIYETKDWHYRRI